MSSNRGRSSSGGSGGGRVIPPQIRVQKYLKGVEYPATKDALVSKAKKEGAGDDVMGYLKGLPDGNYGSPVAVSGRKPG